MPYWVWGFESPLRHRVRDGSGPCPDGNRDGGSAPKAHPPLAESPPFGIGAGMVVFFLVFFLALF